MERVCIYPKDIQLITGKSERWGREIIKRIKEKYNKEDHQLVTIDELCSYLGIEPEMVRKLLR
ncbi:MAG: hypothetical protein U0T69_13960 [Chitinophagales bacterium]